MTTRSATLATRASTTPKIADRVGVDLLRVWRHIAHGHVVQHRCRSGDTRVLISILLTIRCTCSAEERSYPAGPLRWSTIDICQTACRKRCLVQRVRNGSVEPFPELTTFGMAQVTCGGKVNMVSYFDEAQVRKLLQWDPLIVAMEQALTAFSAGKVVQPVRNMLVIEENKRYLGVMPAVAPDAMGLKLVSFYPGNAGTGVPTHLGVILLSRPDTGEPLAVMDGRLITEMRTAAVSAAVTKHLAPPETKVLALLGSGVQASAHLEALSRVRRFEEVRVWSRKAQHAQQFASEHNIKASPDVQSAVRDADVIVTATNAQDPFLRGHWVKTGALVNAVGSPRPTWRELDDELMHTAELVVDSREAVLKESGDVILSKAPIYAEVGELFAGTKRKPQPGRTMVFKSVGIAVEDIAAAKLVYETPAPLT
jgi:ornithine cyclodeaminase/alanine dehydrogenase-like protein (mu-crystallin family)